MRACKRGKRGFWSPRASCLVAKCRAAWYGGVGLHFHSMNRNAMQRGSAQAVKPPIDDWDSKSHITRLSEGPPPPALFAPPIKPIPVCNAAPPAFAAPKTFFGAGAAQSSRPRSALNLPVPAAHEIVEDQRRRPPSVGQTNGSRHVRHGRRSAAAILRWRVY